MSNIRVLWAIKIIYGRDLKMVSDTKVEPQGSMLYETVISIAKCRVNLLIPLAQTTSPGFILPLAIHLGIET